MNEDWKVRELTEALRRSEANAAKDRAYIEQLRLELDKHRWIPVSERLPSEEDADAEGYVLVRGVNAEGLAQHDIDLWHGLRYRNSKYWTLTHWQRITPPEGKP